MVRRMTLVYDDGIGQKVPLAGLRQNDLEVTWSESVEKPRLEVCACGSEFRSWHRPAA
jgi:hypothetical protein